MSIEMQHGQAYQHMEKGLHLERQGLLDEAMLEFKHAVEADPSMAMAHHALGQHYQRKGLLTKAADEFHTASLLSGDFDCYFSLGRALTELERYPEACAAFDACLRQDNADPSARYELSYVQFAMGKTQEAITGFQSLLDVYPDDWELKLAIANCHLSGMEYGLARDTLAEGLAKAPAGADTATMRDALAVAERYLELNPEQRHGVKGQLYAELGVACLGSNRDDGLTISAYEDANLSWEDVARTLVRFQALVKEYGWRFTAIVSVDTESTPLALALSVVLDAPVVDPARTRPEDLILLVSNQLVHTEMQDVVLERLPAHVLTFALTVPWRGEKTPAPDIVGIPCSGGCALPFRAAKQQSALAIARRLVRALGALSVEPNLRQQTDYYAIDHTRLRFLDAPNDRAAETAQ